MEEQHLYRPPRAWLRPAPSARKPDLLPKEVTATAASLFLSFFSFCRAALRLVSFTQTQVRQSRDSIPGAAAVPRFLLRSK